MCNFLPLSHHLCLDFGLAFDDGTSIRFPAADCTLPREKELALPGMSTTSGHITGLVIEGCPASCVCHVFFLLVLAFFAFFDFIFGFSDFVICRFFSDFLTSFFGFCSEMERPLPPIIGPRMLSAIQKPLINFWRRLKSSSKK